MMKPALIAALSSLLALPAFAQLSNAEPDQRADPGDAQVVVLGAEGAILTGESAISPPEAVQDMSVHGQTGHIDPVMREGDRLVLEPLVNRIGVDSGSVVETVPVSK